MLFDFQAFVEELRSNESKREIVEKYEKLFGNIQGKLTDQKFYKEYLINFSALPYRTPEELTEEFNWKLLSQLISGSFTSKCYLKVIKNQRLPTFNITVTSGEQSVDKNIEELWSFQIMRLYEIYTEEQMNLHILTKENENEANAIRGARVARLEYWQRHIIAIKTELETRDLLGD